MLIGAGWFGTSDLELREFSTRADVARESHSSKKQAPTALRYRPVVALNGRVPQSNAENVGVGVGFEP